MAYNVDDGPTSLSISERVPHASVALVLSRRQLLRTQGCSFLSPPGPLPCHRSRVRAASSCLLAVTSDVPHGLCAPTPPVGRRYVCVVSSRYQATTPLGVA